MSLDELSRMQQIPKEKSLKQMLLDAGYPESEMCHHYSDLYVFVTPVSTKVINKWCKDRGYSRHWHCPMFVDQITGKPMYECAFQWYEENKDVHKQ